MNRIIVMLGGFLAAGVFAAVMYALHGNLNWGSPAEKSMPWFEPMFWVLALSGLAAVLVWDLLCAARNVLGLARGMCR